MVQSDYLDNLLGVQKKLSKGRLCRSGCERLNPVSLYEFVEAVRVH